MSSILNGREFTYQNDMQRSYMVIKLLQEDAVEEYQVRMIQENPSVQLLPLHRKQIDDEIYIFYDITSKITLNQFLKRKKLKKHEFLSILKGLIKSLDICKQYLLQGGACLLQSDYIYVDPASFELSIAYLPIELNLDSSLGIRDLIMDLVVYKVSFESSADGDFVYELLNLLKSESFNLNQLDKLINSIALTGEQKSIHKNSWKQDETKRETEYVNGSARQDTLISAMNIGNKDSKSSEKYFVVILLQVLCFTIAALFIRFSYLNTGKFDISNILGIVIIVVAIDVLIVKRLKLAGKSVMEGAGSQHLSGILNLSFPITRLNDGMVRNKTNLAAKVDYNGYSANEESKSFINPKDLETQFLSEGMPKYPCLVGCGAIEQEKIYIDKSSFIIGRLRSQSDFISSNSAVGKLHAEIVNKDGTYYIKDLNSRNGTYINGERAVSNVEYSIKHNDRIAFANSEYKFQWN